MVNTVAVAFIVPSQISPKSSAQSLTVDGFT